MNSVRVILIHGTNATGAPWTQKSSEFCQRLAQLCRVELKFEAFSWSGDNSTDAREIAANELAAQITSKRSSPTILVGHSHGGNIACQSIDRLENPTLIVGIVTLNTPFLVTKDGRSPVLGRFGPIDELGEFSLWSLTWSGVWAIGITALCLCLWGLFSLLPEWVFDVGSVLLESGILFSWPLALVLFCLLYTELDRIISFFRTIGHRISRIVSSLGGYMQTGHRPRLTAKEPRWKLPNMLCITANTDEARTGLRFFDKLETLALEIPKFVMALAGLLPILFFFTIAYLNQGGKGIVEDGYGGLLTIVALLTALVFGSFAFKAYGYWIVRILRSLPIAYGESVYETYNRQVSSTPVKGFSDNVELYRYKPSTLIYPLAHSTGYSDTGPIEAIAKFIETNS